MRTFYAPWPDDPAMYPGHVLEQHQAHCRALKLPYETHPVDVRPRLTDKVKALGAAAAHQYFDMLAWAPPSFEPENYGSVRQDILEQRPLMRNIAFWGGRGGSKSHDAIDACVELASKAYERIVVGREFLESIKYSSHALFRTKIKESRWANEWRITDREMTNAATGSTISFLGINRNPDSVRSLEGCTIFLGEEAEAFSETSLDILMPTVRSGGSVCIWLWNPADKGSPMNQMFLQGTPPELSFVRCVLGENNKYFYRTTMPIERRQSWVKHTRAKFRHIWRGALDLNPELAVFSNWSVGRLPLPEAAVPRYGVDWGWQDPFACLEFFVVEPADPETERGKIYIHKEVYGSKIPARELPVKVAAVMPMARDHTMTADSAEPKSIEDFNNAGFHVIPARKGPGSIRAGISLIQGYDIVVSPECPNVAAELEAYRWKKNKSGVVLRDPEDADNHSLDALRYGMEDYTPPPPNDGVDYV